jgi:threonine dehydrogenase-like Zn-dependent dehydrogenase
VREESEVVGSYAFARHEIGGLREMLRAGTIDLSDSISHRFPLEEVNSGLSRLRDKSAPVGRILVVP